jgi:flagellar biosynthesis anti-sigma factor FlgM
MEISPETVRRVLALHTRRLEQGRAVTPPDDSGAANDTYSSDRVEISSEFQLLKDLHQAIADLPEVDPDKVAQVAEEMDQGRYAVSPEELAATMLGTPL